MHVAAHHAASIASSAYSSATNTTGTTEEIETGMLNLHASVCYMHRQLYRGMHQEIFSGKIFWISMHLMLSKLTRIFWQ